MISNSSKRGTRWILLMLAAMATSLAASADPTTVASAQPEKPKHPARGPTFTSAATLRPKHAVSGKTESALISEIQLVEQMLTSTTAASPTHATVVRRLAETYYELGRLKADAAVALSAQILATQKAKGDATDDLAKRAKARRMRDKCRVKAAEYYRRFLDDHATDPHADEVTYDLALQSDESTADDATDAEEVKLAKDAHDQALKVFLELVKNYPSSPFVAPAYATYGDLYFDDAVAGKVTFDVALEAYGRVANIGDASDNGLWIYAHYKLGFVQWNLKSRADAIVELKRAIEAATKYSEQPGASAIKADAEKALREI
ncbi:MAG: tol-pal system YbgF family protein [Polyangiales bacterium]